VTVTIWQLSDPYDYVEVRGSVVDIIEGPPARAHIDTLAQRYFGRPYDESIITSARVLLRIAPVVPLTQPMNGSILFREDSP